MKRYLQWLFVSWTLRRLARVDPDRFGLWCDENGFDPDVVRARVRA